MWHRILQNVCHIETRQLGTVERWRRGLTLYSVIAWRVFHATVLARASLDRRCEMLLAIEQQNAVYYAIHHCPTPPENSPSLGEAVR